MQINADPLSQIATASWSAAALGSEQQPAFQPELVQQIYKEHLGGAAGQPPGLRKVMLLEISQYLENYLWPNFDAANATPQHVLSILLMVNEKFRENVPAWDCFDAAPVRCLAACTTLPSSTSPHVGCSLQRPGLKRFIPLHMRLRWGGQQDDQLAMQCLCRWSRRGTRGSRRQRRSRRSA